MNSRNSVFGHVLYLETTCAYSTLLSLLEFDLKDAKKVQSTNRPEALSICAAQNSLDLVNKQDEMQTNTKKKKKKKKKSKKAKSKKSAHTKNKKNK